MAQTAKAAWAIIIIAGNYRKRSDRCNERNRRSIPSTWVYIAEEKLPDSV